MTTRAAFDIGSGAIRLQVADVHEKTIHSHFVAHRSIGFARDLKTNGRDEFSPHILDNAVKLIQELKALASPFCPEVYRGIATEAFRLSKNSEALLSRIYDETGVHITVVSHEEEAQYGFLNALCHSKLAKEEIISWDSGAGSFQISCHDGDLFLARLGRIPVQHYIVETAQGRDFSEKFSPNPVSYEEAMQTVEYIQSRLQPVPKHLIAHFERGTVISLGAHSRLIPHNREYTLKDVKELLLSSLNKADSDFGTDEPHFIVSDLILEYSVMLTLGINKAYRLSTKESGNTSGLLVHPNLWKSMKYEV